jgi:hypothetical protein
MTIEVKSERLRRGSNPPYIGLGEALSLACDIYEHGGGQASRDLMSRMTGNSASSSSLIKKIGALKSYGLVTEQGEVVSLTDQGNAIAAPTGERIESEAKKAAFLNVQVFSRIYERHKGKLLPADEFLRNIVEQDCGIPRDLAPSWVAAFRDAARVAGLLLTRPDGKIQIMETPALHAAAPEALASTSDVQIISDPAGPPKNANPNISSPRTPGSANVASFEVSDGRTAEFSIPIGITARDAKRLKAYLDGLKLIIDAAVIDPVDGNP